MKNILPMIAAAFISAHKMNGIFHHASTTS